MVDAQIADDRPTPSGVEDLNVRLEPEHRAQQEADHHKPVGNSDALLLEHLGVAKNFANGGDDTSDGVVDSSG